MRKKVSILLCILLVFALTTCTKDHLFDCTKSSGPVISENRRSGPFQNLKVEDNVDIRYHFDSLFRIKVTAGQHLIDGIITELNGTTLYVRNENRCNWVRSFKNTYTVDLYSPELLKVEMYGSGDFTTLDTLRTYEFSFESWNASGSAQLLLDCGQVRLINNIGRMDITAAGKVGVAQIYINDTGVLEARNLESNYCYVRSSTTGVCSVRARTELGAEIKSVGDIYYAGQPASLNQTITGSGRLIPL